jgi:hypothetical protein
MTVQLYDIRRALFSCGSCMLIFRGIIAHPVCPICRATSYAVRIGDSSEFVNGLDGHLSFSRLSPGQRRDAVSRYGAYDGDGYLYTVAFPNLVVSRSSF